MSRHSPARHQHANYPIVIPVLSRFADVDPLWHVNNIAIAQYFEEGRVAGMRQMVGGERIPATGGRTLIARLTIDYLQEASYPGALEVGVGVLRIGTTSYTLGLALFQRGTCVAISDAVMVNADANGPARLSGEMRARLESYLVPDQPARSAG